MTINIPTLLTLSRLILSPLILPWLLIFFLPLNILWINALLSLLFILFGVTDFLDGYLARAYQQETALGKMLDPVADKFLVYSTLIALVATKKLFFFWPIIIIGREFFIMSLREIALSKGFSVSVMSIGKLKTCAQMLFIAFVILNPAQHQGSYSLWNSIESILVVTTIILTLYSALSYGRTFWCKWTLIGCC